MSILSIQDSCLGNYHLGRNDKNVSEPRGNGAYLDLAVSCGRPCDPDWVKEVWTLLVKVNYENRMNTQNFNSLTGKLSALVRQRIYCSGEVSNSKNGYINANAVQELFRKINIKTYETRCHYCTPCRFILTLLNLTPIPVEGRVPNKKGDWVASFVSVSYLSDIRTHQENLMQLQLQGSEQNSRLYSPYIPFVALSIDRYTLSREYVQNGFHRFFSIRGRAHLLLRSLAFAVAIIVMPILQIIQIAQNRNLWPTHQLYLSIPDALLGIAVSPVFALANSIKCAVAAIIHPRIVYAELLNESS